MPELPGESNIQAHTRELMEVAWSFAKTCATFAVSLSEQHNGDRERVRDFIENNRELLIDQMPPEVAINMMWVLDEVFAEQDES